MAKLTIKERMIRSIANRKGEVVLRKDFEKMGSSSQISRLLRELVSAGQLIRIGYGVYAKARKSTITGNPVPREPLEVIAQEALGRLGVDAKQGRQQQLYTQAETEQIPMLTTFNTGNRRVSRRLTVGNRTVRYENDYVA